MHASKVDVVVLACLSEQPLHGYDLLERMKDRSMGLWAEVGKASVYQALQRLERAALIVGRHQEGAEGPDRRVFRITSAGREQLRRGLVECSSSSDPFQSRAGLALGFLHLLSAAEARDAVDARERGLRDLLEAADRERARIATAEGAGPALAGAMLSRQRSLAEAELAWIKGFRTYLRKLRRHATVG